MNVIGLYMFKDNYNISNKFMYITVVDSAMGTLEIEKIPGVVSMDKNGTTDSH